MNTVLGDRELFSRPNDERALLSLAMHDIDMYYDLNSSLTAQELLSSDHQILLMIMESIANKGADSFDLSMIVSSAKDNQVLEQVGGAGYIQAVYNMEVSKSNFKVYLENVMDSVLKYKLYRGLKESVVSVENNAKEGKSAADLLAEAESSIFDLATGNKYLSEPKDLAVGLDEYLAERKENRIEMSGLSTGYPILDKQIDGLIPGTLFIVGARKKKGKSALLTNIAVHVAYRLRKPVLYVDTELSFNEWRTRALARILSVKEREIKHGGYDEDTMKRIELGKRLIKEGLLYHEYMPGYSVDKLVSLYKKFKLQKGLGLIVFDYLKEPESSSVDRQRKEYQILGDVTTKLKDLSGQLDIPAVTAVQLNRDHDVADSDRIARYGDIVAFWDERSKEEMEAGGTDCGTHKLFIKDTRRGGSTPFEGIGYFFYKELLTIKEVPVDRQYFMKARDGVVNAGSADAKGYEAEELH